MHTRCHGRQQRPAIAAVIFQARRAAPGRLDYEIVRPALVGGCRMIVDVEVISAPGDTHRTINRDTNAGGRSRRFSRRWKCYWQYPEAPEGRPKGKQCQARRDLHGAAEPPPADPMHHDEQKRERAQNLPHADQQSPPCYGTHTSRKKQYPGEGECHSKHCGWYPTENRPKPAHGFLAQSYSFVGRSLPNGCYAASPAVDAGARSSSNPESIFGRSGQESSVIRHLRLPAVALKIRKKHRLSKCMPGAGGCQSTSREKVASDAPEEARGRLRRSEFPYGAPNFLAELRRNFGRSKFPCGLP